MRRLEHGAALLVATHNRGKLEELAALLDPHGITVTGAADHDLAEPDETETSFVGNARIKAHAAARATGLPALADDSGLEVDALDGAPGVYTADWAETGSGRDFDMAMRRVHDSLLSKARRNRGRRGFAARWFWHGPMATTRFSPARSRAGSSGRCAAIRAMDMIPFFRPTGMT